MEFTISWMSYPFTDLSSWQTNNYESIIHTCNITLQLGLEVVFYHLSTI